MQKLIGYVRVSTQKQSLGLEAQQEALQRYATAVGGTFYATYEEKETGTVDSREELQKAIEHAKLINGTLVIAKLDRLARSVGFTDSLMKSGIRFIACDNPDANPLTIHILAALAEHEAKMISTRTREALAMTPNPSGKASPNYGTGEKSLTPEERERRQAEGRRKGTAESARVKREKASQHAKRVLAIAGKYREQGLPLRAVADKLNEQGVVTSRGGRWYAGNLRAILEAHSCQTQLCPNT